MGQRPQGRARASVAHDSFGIFVARLAAPATRAAGAASLPRCSGPERRRRSTRRHRAEKVSPDPGAHSRYARCRRGVASAGERRQPQLHALSRRARRGRPLILPGAYARSSPGKSAPSVDVALAPDVRLSAVSGRHAEATMKRGGRGTPSARVLRPRRRGWRRWSMPRGRSRPGGHAGPSPPASPDARSS